MLASSGHHRNEPLPAGSTVDCSRLAVPHDFRQALFPFSLLTG